MRDFYCFFARAAMLVVVLGHGPAFSGELPEPVSENSRTVEFLGLRTSLSDRWQVVQPRSSMRLAQFRLGGVGHAESAELIFYYFGAGQGGTPQANISRWTSQFSDDRGAAIEPRVKAFHAGGMPVTQVVLTGRYARGIGAGPGGAGQPGQTLIAAMLQTARGQVTIQLFGDSHLVAEMKDDFDGMLHRFGPAGDP